MLLHLGIAREYIVLGQGKRSSGEMLVDSGEHHEIHRLRTPEIVVQQV